MSQPHRVSCDFIVQLADAGASRRILRALAKDSENVFEACARRRITPEQAAFVLELKREASMSWIVRLVRWILSKS